VRGATVKVKAESEELLSAVPHAVTSRSFAVTVIVAHHRTETERPHGRHPALSSWQGINETPIGLMQPVASFCETAHRYTISSTLTTRFYAVAVRS